MKRLEPVACPFCEKETPRPKKVAAGIVETEGGRCDCGAVYVADLTGRQGGECLMDGLTILCGGDLDAASNLVAGEDYELVDICYRPRTHSVEPPKPGPRSFGQAKLWFIRQLKP